MPRKYPISIAIALALAGCGSPESPPSATAELPAESGLGTDAVAIVDSKPIPRALLERLSLVAAQRDASTLTPDQQTQLVNQLVTLRVLADAAEKNGLQLQSPLAAELELQRLQILARAATETFRSENAPTEAELRAAYEENLPRYLATQYKARHILVETEDEAAALIAQLDAGADFAQLAIDHSTGPTGPNGGDLGWFTADSMVAPFADAVRAANVGSYVQSPIQTQFGWHVILVEDVREQQPPGLEAVRSELVALVEREKLEGYVQSLSANAEISKPNE